MDQFNTKVSGQSSPPRPWLNAYPSHVHWDATFEPAPLFTFLDNAAQRFGESPCTSFEGRTLTYRDIAAAVNAAAAGLQRRGVTKGVNVGLFLPNSPTFIIYYYAILKAGGTVVNFSPLAAVEELSNQIADSDITMMVTLDLKILFDKIDATLASGVLKQAIVVSFASLLPAHKAPLFKIFKAKDRAWPLASTNRDKIILERDLMAGDPNPKPVAIDPVKDIAVLQYTGGTTGVPKGAMLSHANLTINTLQVISWAQDLKDGEERVMGVLPFFHVFAMTVVMNFGIAKAAEIIVIPKFNLDTGLRIIDKRKPTIMPGVPALFNAIANHPKVKTFNLRSLKFCLSGGAPLMVETKQAFERETGCTLIEGYGLSEASPVVTCNPVGMPPRSGSIGLPLPATLITLRDPADPMREITNPNERGEVCVQGPQVMLGYWKRPAETAAQFAGPHLRTGDIGQMDQDGYFYIVDRSKDLIISKGLNVYPRRIEEVIADHSAVEEVCVIGIPDAEKGEAAKAFIKLKAGTQASAADIKRHFEPRLTKYEWPVEIEFRESLPKTMIGKLSKKDLKEEEAKKRAARGT